MRDIHRWQSISAALALAAAGCLRRLDALRHDATAADAVLATTSRELDAARDERTHLVWRMHRAVEEERRRIAADLHNRPLQELAGVGYALERVSMAMRRGDHDAAQEMIDEAAEELVRQLEAIRLIMTDLRPPVLDERGLVGALAGIKARMQHEHPELQVQISGGAERIGVETETILYRIAQEALSNAARHAEASVVAVSISRDDVEVQMSVQDNGMGFDLDRMPTLVERGHYGIAAMRERASMIDGTVEITTGGAGTTVVCRAPRADFSAAHELERRRNDG